MSCCEKECQCSKRNEVMDSLVVCKAKICGKLRAGCLDVEGSIHADKVSADKLKVDKICSKGDCLHVEGDICINGRAIEGPVQIIHYHDETIDPKTRTVVFDRLDWKPNVGGGRGTFTEKCGHFMLPEKQKQGTRILFYNHHKSINILEHPDPFGSYPGGNAPKTNAEFRHILMNDNHQVVELEWIDWNHGWTIINMEHGHGNSIDVLTIASHPPKYLYSLCTFRRLPGHLYPDDARDYVATIDINPESVQYGKIVNIALGSQQVIKTTSDFTKFALGEGGLEYHHGDLLHINGKNFVAAPSLNVNKSAYDFFSLDALSAPALSSYLTEGETSKIASAFHTTHFNRQTNKIIASALGKEGSLPDSANGPGGFVQVSANVGAYRLTNQPNPVTIEKYYTLKPSDSPTGNTQGNPDTYNYDFAIDECNNELACTSWGPPSSFDTGFDTFLTKPYGRSIRIYKMPQEGTNEPDVANMLNIEATLVTSPTPELGGPSDGEGVVPLEVRRVHEHTKRIYFVGVTLPGAIDLIYKNGGVWQKKVIVTPTQLRAHCKSILIGNPVTLGVPVYNLKDAGFGPANLGEVPLVTDITLSQDDHFLYVSCWLAGALLQYDVRKFLNADEVSPAPGDYADFIGGVGNLGGLRGNLNPGPQMFNPKSYQYGNMSEVYAGGPQMLRLDADGSNIYVTNSLFSSWDAQFYDFVPGLFNAKGNGSIEEKGGMLIKIKTGVKQGEKVDGPGPMQIDIDFGKKGVIEFKNLTHPGVSAPFTSRAHECHIMGVHH